MDRQEWQLTRGQYRAFTIGIATVCYLLTLFWQWKADGRLEIGDYVRLAVMPIFLILYFEWRDRRDRRNAGRN